MNSGWNIIDDRVTILSVACPQKKKKKKRIAYTERKSWVCGSPTWYNFVVPKNSSRFQRHIEMDCWPNGGNANRCVTEKGSPSLSAWKWLVENFYMSMFSTNHFRADRKVDPTALFLLCHTTVRVSPIGSAVHFYMSMEAAWICGHYKILPRRWTIHPRFSLGISDSFSLPYHQLCFTHCSSTIVNTYFSLKHWEMVKNNWSAWISFYQKINENY